MMIKHEEVALFIKTQMTMGAALVTTPVWNYYLQDFSQVASAVAALCGAIVGLHAVYRTWRYRKDYNNWRRKHRYDRGL